MAVFRGTNLEVELKRMRRGGIEGLRAYGNKIFRVPTCGQICKLRGQHGVFLGLPRGTPHTAEIERCKTTINLA